MSTVRADAVAETSPTDFMKSLAAAVLGGAFAFMVVLGMSGEFGQWLKGIRLSGPPSGSVDPVLLHGAVAAVVTAGVFAGSTAWQLENRRLRRLAAVDLLAVALVLAFRTPSLSEAAVVMVPALVAVAALGTARLLERREAMLRHQSCGRLWASIFLASWWAVGSAFAVI